MKKNDELLNWQQACKIIGCSRSYFYNLVNAGILKAVKFGERKGIRVSKKDCLKFINSKNLINE